MTALPSHLFVSDSDGALYDTRTPHWSARSPVRAVYSRTFARIATAAELKATLRAGAYAWPGGYPLYFVMADGGAASFEGVRANLRDCLASFAPGGDSAWRPAACAINYESALVCDLTGQAIESAYGDDEEGE